MGVPYSDQSLLPGLIVLGYELLVGSLHQPLDVLPADTETRQLIYDDCVNILDVHKTMHSPNPEQITVQREAEDLAHQLIFKFPTPI